MGASTATGFVATDPAASRPDVQIGLVVYSTDKFGDTLHPFSGFTMLVRLLKPESRGTVLDQERRSARSAGDQAQLSRRRPRTARCSSPE